MGIKSYEVDDNGNIIKVEKTTSDLLFAERCHIIDNLSPREKAAFVLGMSYESARFTQLEIKRCKEQTPADMKELKAVREALETLNISTPLKEL